jgi:2-polyprenyl-3-methyl-5-hydroxy-6-metoxy-1,4-benzoquinol methylase
MPDSPSGVDHSFHITTDMSAEELRPHLESMGPWQHEVVFSNGLKTSDFETREPFTTFTLWKLRMLEEHIPMEQLRGGRALDIGSICGYNSMHLAQEYGMKVTGIDIFDRWLEIARFFSSLANTKGVNFEKESGDRFLRPDTFDLILHLGTLYHLQNPMQSLGYSYRNLRAGGYLGLETTAYNGSDELLCKFIYGLYFGDVTNYWALSKRVLETCLGLFGFSDVKLIREVQMVDLDPELSRVLYVARKPPG